MLTVTAHADRAALAHRVPQLLGDLERVLVAGAGQDHQDLLAADPVDRVARPQGRPHRVGDVLQDRVAGGVAEPVVDGLEVVEVAEQEGVGEALARVAGLSLELGEALLQRVAVEEAGERVERRAAAVGAVGLDQGAGEDHGADDQRGDRDQRLLLVPAACGSGRTARQEQRDHEGGAEGHPAGLEAEAEGDGGEGEPDEGRAGGAAGDRAPRRQAGPERRPGAGDPDRRPGAGAHEAVGDREAGEAGQQQRHPPVADRAAGDGEGQGENPEAGEAVAAHAHPPCRAGARGALREWNRDQRVRRHCPCAVHRPGKNFA